MSAAVHVFATISAAKALVPLHKTDAKHEQDSQMIQKSSQNFQINYTG